MPRRTLLSLVGTTDGRLHAAANARLTEEVQSAIKCERNRNYLAIHRQERLPPLCPATFVWGADEPNGTGPFRYTEGSLRKCQLDRNPQARQRNNRTDLRASRQVAGEC
mmetsp:Transcript_46257/g.128564  ORF Transcript_46257/g.128564 Transcript_46257/m.128564 type:complete len:109 (+) Transcript_46257:1095-1421(+)